GLGRTDNNEIWIDRTAAGWGWSTDATPAAGRMDLSTVVTHEFGHILDLAPTATGVMEVTLSPGVRQVPEAFGNVANVPAVAISASGSVATASTQGNAAARRPRPLSPSSAPPPTHPPFPTP